LIVDARDSKRSDYYYLKIPVFRNA